MLHVTGSDKTGYERFSWLTTRALANAAEVQPPFNEWRKALCLFAPCRALTLTAAASGELHLIATPVSQVPSFF